jgi:hypothetical protein
MYRWKNLPMSLSAVNASVYLPVSEQKDMTMHAHERIMSVVQWPSLLNVLGNLQRTVCALACSILTALLHDGYNHETPTIPGVYDLLANSFPPAFASLRCPQQHAQGHIERTQGFRLAVGNMRFY